MKIINFLKIVDKSENNKCFFNFYYLRRALDYKTRGYINSEDALRLSCYWIANWYSTDTWVGARAYYLDNEPIAYSIESSRESDEEFYWVSKDAFFKCREYVISLDSKKKDEGFNFNLIDEDDSIELDEMNYRIDFNNDILEHSLDRAVYKDERVKIIEKLEREDCPIISSELIIKTKRGIEKVDIKELKFLFHTVNNPIGK